MSDDVSEAEVEAAARADAAFDRRDFNKLGRADRRRYLDRCRATLTAAAQARASAAETEIAALRGEVEKLRSERDEERDLNREYHTTPVGTWIARAERAQAVLQHLEWSGNAFIAEGTGRFCPICQNWENDGHARDCALARALDLQRKNSYVVESSTLNARLDNDLGREIRRESSALPATEPQS